MKKTLIFILLPLIFAACNKQEEGTDLENIAFQIYSPYGTHFITRYDIPFKATDEEGNDITPAVTFYVNGQAQPDDTLRFDQPGTYQISAEWDLGGVKKELDTALQVEVINPRSETYALIEDFTGTWCVNCPRVIYHLEEALAQNNRIVPVAIHNRGYNTDPFHFDQVDILANEYNIQAYPTPLLNRLEIWDEEVQSVNNYTSRNQPLGLRVSNQINGNQLEVNVQVRFDMDMQSEDLKLTVYLLENHLHADQANATSYYGGQDPIPDFEHNHVLRHSLTGVLGDDIPKAETAYDHIYERNFQLQVPPQVENPGNITIVAFVTRGQQQATVINAKKVNVNATADF